MGTLTPQDPLGPIETGRRGGQADPRAAIRFRVFPFARPGHEVRLRLAPVYHAHVLVLNTAENGYSLGEVLGAWTGPALIYRSEAALLEGLDQVN